MRLETRQEEEAWLLLVAAVLQNPGALETVLHASAGGEPTSLAEEAGHVADTVIKAFRWRIGLEEASGDNARVEGGDV